MAISPKLPLGHMLALARNKLGMTQREFGPALGVSHRTATRWDSGRATPDQPELTKLAELLVPIDMALAAEAAAHARDTLEGLGLVAPKPPPAVAVAQPGPAPTPPEDLADIVVCAAAEASDVSPRSMRSLLYVAFRRAHQVGLTVEQVERALAPPDTRRAKKS
jgi:transcriptional regulator with XRE-family HTH domain